MSAKVKKYGKILAVLLTVLVTIVLAGIGVTWTKAQVVTEYQEVTISESTTNYVADSVLEDSSTLEKEPTSNDDDKQVIREIPEKRDANHRHWEIVKEIEVVDPVTREVSVKEEISRIAEVGSGICYKDEYDNWQVTDASWRQTDTGFVMDTAGYKLEIGNTINEWLHYVVGDTDMFLRPGGIIASDGTNEAEVAVLNTTAAGAIDPDDPSRLIFQNAYGPGIDLELQVNPDGYHQNIIFNTPFEISGNFDRARTRVHVQTELTLDDYIINQGMGIITDKEEFVDLPEDFRSQSTYGNIEFVKLEEEDGVVYGYDRFYFAESKVFDNKLISNRVQTVAKKQLRQNSRGASLLVEILDMNFFDSAEYPVTWDYRTKSGTITSDKLVGW